MKFFHLIFFSFIFSISSLFFVSVLAWNCSRGRFDTTISLYICGYFFRKWRTLHSTMETLWTMNKKKSRYLLLVVFFCRCLGLFCHVRKRREKKVKRHFHAFYLHGHAVKCDFIDVSFSWTKLQDKLHALFFIPFFYRVTALYLLLKKPLYQRYIWSFLFTNCLLVTFTIDWFFSQFFIFFKKVINQI